MADEPAVEDVVVPAAEVVDPPAPPHPLEEGGARFNEVYARMKAAEERATRAEAERAALAVQQRPAQPVQPAYYQPQQLQEMVDRGQITQAVMADMISKQNATATVMQVAQITQHNQRMAQASDEVHKYIAKVPALMDVNSAEFKKVADEAYRISDDVGAPVSDLRVQRMALRAVYGSLDRMAARGSAQEQSRNASLPHVETASGATGRPVTGKVDPLEGVPAEYLEYWKKRGYTREKMIEEAQYVDKTRSVRKVRTR